MFPLAPCFRTPSACVLPPFLETKFHTHAKQHANCRYVYFNLHDFSRLKYWQRIMNRTVEGISFLPFPHFFNSIVDDMCLGDFYWWMMPTFLPPPRTVARKNFFLPFRYVCCLELDTFVQRVAVCVRRSLGGRTRKKDKKFSSCKQRRHGEILKLWVSCHEPAIRCLSPAESGCVRSASLFSPFSSSGGKLRCFRTVEVSCSRSGFM